MIDFLRKIFRISYYSVYGKSGKNITINNKEYTVSAYVSRGVRNTNDDAPLKVLSKLAASQNVNLFFDIGANIGIIAMMMAKEMKKGSVIYSFEPAPTSYKYLKDTARVHKGNAKIIPVNLAVSNNNDKLYFTNDGNSCTNHVSNENEAGTINVDSITIDSFCEKQQVIPQVIKIDIEGAEYWALEGMKKTLKNNSCIVLIEIHLDFLVSNKIDGNMFGNLIDSVGYKVFDINGDEIKSNEVLKHAIVVLSKENLPKKIFQVE